MLTGWKLWGMAFFDLLSEASCASTVRTARAVVEEAAGSVSLALHSLASKSENHAETSFHKLAKDQGLSLDIPLTELGLSNGQSFPVLLLSNWVKLILTLDTDLFCQVFC